jgi:hypothetical protein
MRTIALGLGFLLALSSTAQAQPTEVAVGKYKTSGMSPYKDGTIDIVAWADRYKYEGKLVRNGREYEVKLTVAHIQGNQFGGNGTITVRYPNGTGCVHKMGARLWAYPDKVFLRENTPRYIPYNPNGPCTAAGPYVWHDHPEAYQLVP